MKSDPLHLLNRLLAVHCRSFPQYLRYARPYVPPGYDEELETLEAVAADQDAISDRINRTIIDLGGLPHTGEFPMDFTDMHDLHIDFLMRTAVRCQEQDVAKIQELVDRLQTALGAKALAEETLGMAKGHLDSLREVLRPSSRVG